MVEEPKDWPKGGEERDSHTCTLNSREYHSRARGRTKECTRATAGFIFDRVCVPGDDSGRRRACCFAEQVQQVDLQRLYQAVNHDSFAGSLPNVPVRWSDLTKDDAYGVTHFDKG